MDNKDKLKAKIIKYIDETIDELAKMNKLGFFDIEIKVHQDNVNFKYTIKDRGKVN